MSPLAAGSKVSGRNGRIYWGGIDISGYSNQWEINIAVGHVDVGGFLENWDSGVQANPNWSASVSGFAKGGHAASLSTKLFDMSTGGDYPFLVYPEDNATGKDYFYTIAHASALPFKAGRKDALTYSLSLMPGVPGDLYHFDL